MAKTFAAWYSPEAHRRRQEALWTVWTDQGEETIAGVVWRLSNGLLATSFTESAEQPKERDARLVGSARHRVIDSFEAINEETGEIIAIPVFALNVTPVPAEAVEIQGENQ